MFRLKNKMHYVGWMLTFVASYIFIRIIDNYQLIFSIVGFFLSILTPFIIGTLAAYILSPIINFLERNFRFKRWMSVFFTHGFILLASTIFLFLMIPILTTNLMDLINDIPSYVAQLSYWITTQIQDGSFLNDPEVIESINQYILDFIPLVGNFVTSGLNNILSITLSVTNTLINLILAFLISIYLLLDRENIITYIQRIMYTLLKEKTTNRIIELVNTFNSTVGRYIVAKSIDSFFVGVISIIGLSLIGSHYAVLLGIICGITNMIPYFGPLLGMVPVVIINIFSSIKIALYCFIFLLILQQIEGNIIEPKFVGGKLGLSPTLTLFAVTIGGGLFGIIGMVLSVPVMGVIKIYTDRMLDKYGPII